MKNHDKRVIIIAGPNGAGKTTFANEFLPKEAGCFQFVNADLIAAGLSPFQPEKAAVKAGRIMISQIDEYINHEISFAFETTLSGKRYARLIPGWSDKGWYIKLIFLKLSSPEMAVFRVKKRISQGGHGIPEKIIQRRYAAGLENFENLYKPIVDKWILYNSSYHDLIILDESE
ncbi:p-loop domain-containing protein [Desulfonema limicola]|uniref:P-loop domain-containing protein n=1 Tax=Desulfonema limicola TaxID=45656 RepID=A0A975B622_9BACT|nr:zeta toxin family protein [Desulfonema limicola]QTA79459.1 p-loop domain-containing protein [Desulfonema limicola]